jgi:hypothetical protein
VTSNLQIFQVNFKDENEAKQIICLLKCAFPKTTYFSMDWWKWKYLSIPDLNPLGWGIRETKTDQIVAIRLFWPVNLVNNKLKTSGYQPVDTATHPSYQGQGLFSSLIKHSLKEIKPYNPIIFNFPNNQSLNPYLKNGWVLYSTNRWVSSLIKPTVKGKFLSISQIKNDTIINPIEHSEKGIYVNWDQASIRWRFGMHPFFNYHVAQNNLGYAVFRKDLIYGIPVKKLLLARYTSLLFLDQVIYTLSNNRFNVVGYNGLNKSLVKAMKPFSLLQHSHGNANYTINNLTHQNLNNPLFEIGDSDFI